MLDKHVCFTTFVFKLFIINTIMFRLSGAVLAELKLVLSAVKDMKKAAEEEAKAAKLQNAATAKAQAAILAKFVEGSSEFAGAGPPSLRHALLRPKSAVQPPKRLQRPLRTCNG